MRHLTNSQFFSLVRTLFGMWLIQHFIFLIPHGSELFSSEGMKVAGGALYLKDSLAPLRSPAGITAVLILATASSIMFTIRIKRALNSFFLFLCWIFLFHQDLLSYNPGVPYIGWMLIALALVPSTEERFFWENKHPDFSFPPVLFWGLWIIVATGYSASGIHKFLYSPLWREGRAFIYILDYPAARSEFIKEAYYSIPLLFQKIICWAVILIESLFFLSIINTGFRKWMWILNTSMHLGILITLKFGGLSVIMIIIHMFMIEDSWFKFGGISKLKPSKVI